MPYNNFCNRSAADSKQHTIVQGRPCGSVAQMAECSHGKPDALGSSPTVGPRVCTPLRHLVGSLSLSHCNFISMYKKTAAAAGKKGHDFQYQQ